MSIVMKTRQDYQRAFLSLGITLTPAGQWELNEQGKKIGKTKFSTHRKNHQEWQNYENDNMAKHYLQVENNILIVDIDGEHVVFNEDSIVIPILNLTLPYSFYTTTTRDNKFHIYYKHDLQAQPLPARIVALNQSKVDVFTYGNIFEWHSFSPSHKLHDLPLVQAPTELITLLLDQDLPLNTGGQEVTPTTNVQRFNLVTKFLNDELELSKQWFAFFKNVFPQEYMPKGKRKLSFQDFPLSYDLFNKISVKLTATSELDHYEHTIPTLYKLLESWGMDPLSTKSQQLIHKNILPSLPEHEALKQYHIEDDVLAFQEHLNQQDGTTSPIFKVIEKGLKYIEIDKLSQVPIPHNGNFFLDTLSAQSLHPERNIVNEEGKKIGWDDNIPIVYYMNDPYEPQYIFDDKHYRHTINLYTPSEYMSEAEQLQQLPKDNIVYKTLYSGIGPNYLELVMMYHAHIIFGRESLNMVLWMASLPTDLGGAGKSIATVELLSMIAGGSVQSINEKTAMSGWGDVVSSSRMISLEDMTDLGKKEWDQIYAMIKQQTSNAFRKLNMKGAALDTKRVSVSLSGSSNHRPMLPPSDRRFLCLEPAHLRGETEPLSADDSKEISRILRSRDHEEEVQVYVNHLLYLYSKPLTGVMHEALFERTPQTIYRGKWVGEGATNTQNVIHSLPDVVELLSLTKTENELELDMVLHLLQMVMVAWNEDTQKSAVSYKWFVELLPFVLSERHKENIYSKHAVSKMLQIDFKNVGQLYHNTWRMANPVLPQTDWKKWPTEGYVFNLSTEQYSQYSKVISELLEGGSKEIQKEINL